MSLADDLAACEERYSDAHHMLGGQQHSARDAYVTHTDNDNVQVSNSSAMNHTEVHQLSFFVVVRGNS